MENDILNKIEEYNKGGLLNEPIIFSTKVDPHTAATLINNFSSATAGFGFGSFCIPKEHTVEIAAEHIVDNQLIREDPVNAEIYIRKELARKLANMLIEEDLIKIQTSNDPALLTTKVRAMIKIIQE